MFARPNSTSPIHTSPPFTNTSMAVQPTHTRVAAMRSLRLAARASAIAPSVGERKATISMDTAYPQNHTRSAAPFCVRWPATTCTKYTLYATVTMRVVKAELAKSYMHQAQISLGPTGWLV